MCAIPTAVRAWKVTFMGCSIGLARSLRPSPAIFRNYRSVNPGSTMTAVGQKAKNSLEQNESGLPPKADSCVSIADVAEGPQPDSRDGAGKGEELIPTTKSRAVFLTTVAPRACPDVLLSSKERVHHRQPEYVDRCCARCGPSRSVWRG